MGSFHSSSPTLSKLKPCLSISLIPCKEPVLPSRREVISSEWVELSCLTLIGSEPLLILGRTRTKLADCDSSPNERVRESLLTLDRQSEPELNCFKQVKESCSAILKLDIKKSKFGVGWKMMSGQIARKCFVSHHPLFPEIE